MSTPEEPMGPAPHFLAAESGLVAPLPSEQPPPIPLSAPLLGEQPPPIPLSAPLPSEQPPVTSLSAPDPGVPPTAVPIAALAPPVSPAQTRMPPDELEVRRDRLAGELAQLQWDLGGLTYEMAIRDHFRLDVLVRQAARLQEIDAELADTERLLRLGNAGASGTCPKCAALYARGAGFCWRCGTQLLEPTTPAAAAG